MSNFDNNNSSRLNSDHTTSDGSKRKDSDGYSWSNYSGVKGSRDVEVNQMNSKDYDGNHSFYSPKTGVSGQAGSNSNRKE